jgi:glucosamine--fructose-6-phosphate aminotransferase (isomerizing)
MSMSRLEQEIYEQPQVLSTLLAEGWPQVQSIAQELRRRAPQHVLIAARGTSDSAATYAKYLWGSVNHLPVGLAAPSLYTYYGTPPRLSDTLVVGISQSGMSPDVVSVLVDARTQGMPTLAVTNDTASPLAAAADWVIGLRAGEEKSVAATKTYTTELLAVAMLSAALAANEAMRAQLEGVPQAVAQALKLDDIIRVRAERYRYVEHITMIGRGYNYATALEAAIKVKELTYTATTPYSSADFLHGPIASIHAGSCALVVAPSGVLDAAMTSILDDLAQRAAELIVISDREELVSRAHLGLRLPAGLPEWLSPIVAVIPAQLLAYRLAEARGLNIDAPRGLQKVTETR